MSTLRDVAAEAGVGLGTASRALTGNGYVAAEKKQRIIDAAEKLGYTLQNKTDQTDRKSFYKNERYKIIGVVVPDVTLAFYAEFVKYVDIAFSTEEYRTMIFNTLGVQGRVSEALELAENGVIDGLIINADVTKEEMRRLIKLPVVSFERLLGDKIPCVASDHKAGGNKAGEILYRARCRNVLIITGKHQTEAYADIRNVECRNYLKSRKVCVKVAEYPLSNISVLALEDIVKKYLELYPDIDGIFADDVTAYCCMQEALVHHVRIPRDLKIVGYDGIEILQLSQPKLTTLKQDIPMLARTCKDVLMKCIAKEKCESFYYIPVKLIKGGTV